MVVEEREITVGGDARPARFTSYDVDAFPVPTGREEEWRFTPLKRLKGLLSGADADGKVQVDAGGIADGVTITSIERDHPLVGSVLSPVERVSAIALARFTSGTLISVAKGAVVDAPVTVTLRGEGGTAYGHVVIDVGDEASATIVLDHSGSAVYAQNVEIRVGANASLTLVTVQDWARDAVHVGYHAALVGRDARFRSFTVTMGGDLVRLAPTVRYASTGGDAELNGLVFADAGQHLEHRTLIDHETPKCRSRVAYKVALQGQDAHTVWIGDVVVRKAAEGIDTYELNRNLVLSEGARADSVPNLELETGEVEGAGHASTTGRFDDQQLFYLQSRGIPAVEARRMVVRAFFAEVIAKVPVESLRDRLTGQIEAELEGERCVSEEFVRACAVSDLADGKPFRVDLGEYGQVPVVMVKDRNGIYALYDECTHAAVPLSEGDVDKGGIECWLHGSRFDLVTGKPKSLPATQPVHVFQTRIDGDDVFVALGDKDS